MNIQTSCVVQISKNLCMVFYVKVNPISERLELIDFMGIT